MGQKFVSQRRAETPLDINVLDLMFQNVSVGLGKVC